MFERASQLRLRFASPQGGLATEDLWDLPLSSKVGKANLNDIAVGLDHQIRNYPAVSFVDPLGSTMPEELQLRFDIVKHIIDYRLKQNEEARLKVDKASKKQRLLGILAEKETEGLKVASAEELRKMIEELG